MRTGSANVRLNLKEFGPVLFPETCTCTKVLCDVVGVAPEVLWENYC